MQWHDEAEDRVGGNLRFNLGGPVTGSGELAGKLGGYSRP